MLSTHLKLRTYEREGEVNPNAIPNISAALLPALIEELQSHDPSFRVSPDEIEAERFTIKPDQGIPVSDFADANLVLCIIVPGNENLEANRDAIEPNVTHMLSGVLYPIPGVHVVLFTGV